MRKKTENRKGDCAEIVPVCQSVPNANAKKRKIIAVDFDGTLCENKYPLIGKPKEKVIEYVKAEQENGATIILWTCRAGMFLKSAVAWCFEHGIKLDYVNENEPGMVKLFTNDCRKIFADVYLDDKAMHVREVSDD